MHLSPVSGDEPLIGKELGDVQRLSVSRDPPQRTLAKAKRADRGICLRQVLRVRLYQEGLRGFITDGKGADWRMYEGCRRFGDEVASRSSEVEIS
jgi:hypothetical protein